jgi:poly-beta-hydroxybutyrate-responsive repressor
MAASTQRVVSFGKPGDCGLPPKGTPKNYLMAWLLVMLAEKNLHGYEITKELNEKFEVITDAGTVYRALRQLERDGSIRSWWNPTEQGPPRRVYALTPQGGAALRRWSEALEQYRSNLETFFTLYQRRQAYPSSGKKGA